MHSERVTYLATAEQKAQLEAFAKARGESVGSVLREATSQYISQPPEEKDEFDKAMELLLRELEERLPDWHRKMDSMEASIKRASEAIDRALAGDPK